MTSVSFKVKIILTSLIVFLALFLRLYEIKGHTAFNIDQARDLIVILSHLEEKEPLLLGPKASIGNFHVGPFYYYLITPVVALFPNSPLAPAVLVALIDSLTVGLLVLFFTTFFTFTSGLVAGVLYATSPLAIQYGRFAWNPNPIPFFTMAFLYFCFRFYKRHSLPDYMLACLMCGLAVQLHYQAVLLLLPLGLVTLLTLGKKTIKLIGGGLLTFIACFLPFILYECKNDFFNFKNIYLYFTQDHRYWYERVRWGEYFYNFIPSFLSRLQSGHIYVGRAILWGSMILLICLFGGKLYKVFAHRNQFRTLIKLSFSELVIIVFLLFVLSLRIFKGDKLNYYMAFLYVFPPLVAGTVFFLSKLYIKPFITLFIVGIIAGNIASSPLREPLINDIDQKQAIAAELMKKYGETKFFIEAGDTAYTFPLQYFLKINGRLSVNEGEGIRVKICETGCSSGYEEIFKRGNMSVAEKKN
mgnify:CR=1 FL=1